MRFCRELGAAPALPEGHRDGVSVDEGQPKEPIDVLLPSAIGLVGPGPRRPRLQSHRPRCAGGNACPERSRGAWPAPGAAGGTTKKKEGITPLLRLSPGDPQAGLPETYTRVPETEGNGVI